MIRSSPVLKRSPVKQLLFRRNVANPRIEKPEVHKTTLTSHEKPSGFSSASIKNGNVDQPLFPKGTFWRTYRQSISGFIGGLALALFIMYLWPVATIKASDTIGGVPSRGETAAVGYNRLTKEIDVNIPQTYAHKDKPVDDE